MIACLVTLNLLGLGIFIASDCVTIIWASTIVSFFTILIFFKSNKLSSYALLAEAGILLLLLGLSKENFNLCVLGALLELMVAPWLMRSVVPILNEIKGGAFTVYFLSVHKLPLTMMLLTGAPSKIAGILLLVANLQVAYAFIMSNTFMLYYCYSLVNLVFLTILSESEVILASHLAIGATVHSLLILGIGQLVAETGNTVLLILMSWSPLQLALLLKLVLSFATFCLSANLMFVLAALLIITNSSLVTQPALTMTNVSLWGYSTLALLALVLYL